MAPGCSRGPPAPVAGPPAAAASRAPLVELALRALELLLEFVRLELPPRRPRRLARRGLAGRGRAGERGRIGPAGGTTARRGRRQVRCRVEAEVRRQRRVDPGQLAIAGVAQHLHPHVLEHLFDLEAGDHHLLGKVFGVDAVATARAVFGRRTRRRCERDQGAARTHFRQPAGRADVARLAGERVVPAGVQDHDAGVRTRLVDAAQEQLLDVDRLVLDLLLIAQVDVDRQQEVAAVDLHPVAGVVQHRDGIVLLHPAREFAQRPPELQHVDIELLVDVEAQLAQVGGDQPRVVLRIVERHLRIPGIADHQGDALVRRLRMRRRDDGSEQRECNPQRQRPQEPAHDPALGSWIDGSAWGEHAIEYPPA